MERLMFLRALMFRKSGNSSSAAASATASLFSRRGRPLPSNQKKIKRIELPTHYMEVNYRIRKAVVFYPSSYTNPAFMRVLRKEDIRAGGIRSFSSRAIEDPHITGISSLPAIEDPQINRALKDLMATSWDNLPSAVVHDAKNALSKSVDDKEAHDALKNVFRAAEAVEEFSGIVMSLKMELDDAIGLSGENVRPLPEEYQNAIKTLFTRYNEYLAAFEPKETYLKKKVETELGSKMIYLKMRCGGLEAGWGKVTVLGTSGLSGSYVEQRA